MDPDIKIVVDERVKFSTVSEPLIAGGFQGSNVTSPNPFQVPLSAFPMQPWTTRNVNLSQWFNYGLTPATWTEYASKQNYYYDQSNK